MPLRILEEAISLSESLGEDAESPRFDTLDATYWHVLRSLHSRTCLHARSVLVLLSNGLVGPAWSQWRNCHESTTTAMFIAKFPEMADHYMRYTIVNKYNLAKAYFDTNHREAPTEAEIDELKSLADSEKRILFATYGHKVNSRDYGWSGLRSFRDIEAVSFEGHEWIPRGEYALASERAHSAPNAGQPIEVEKDDFVFVAGPTSGGLTGPADLTSHSILAATHALVLNASPTTEDKATLAELIDKSRAVGIASWIVDWDILCSECGGYRDGAFPPDEIPIADRPDPCFCR